MILKTSLIAFVLVILAFSGLSAETDFYKQFKKDYSQLNRDLLNHTGLRAEVQNFVYKKDVATFTFHEGMFHLLRDVQGRPTTAIFIGQGTATIEIPVHSERQTLMAVTGDSLIHEDFETCFIRFADDLDLKLQEQFQFVPKELPWKDSNRAAKKAQGEVFFRPRMFHTYDNYFQLMRSIHNRGEDGFFWVDFNRYVFNYDPSRPEQVIVGYEQHGGDLGTFEAARFQKQSIGKYNDTLLSDIEYPTTILERTGTVEMSGLDGKTIKTADVNCQVLVNADSIRFMSLFLDQNIDLDSLYADGTKIDFKRRNDFDFTGTILPDYSHAGDTIDIRFFYHGRGFANFTPYVENPQVSPHDLKFITPRGYNYFIAGMGEVSEYNGGRQSFQVTPINSFNTFPFECYASGLDTLNITSVSGLSLKFLIWELMNKRYSECFIPHEMYQSINTNAIDYMARSFGGRPWTSQVYFSPSGHFAMPGIATAPQIACVTEGEMEAFGGYHMIAGKSAAGQWFGNWLRPQSDRDRWLMDALPEYVAILYIQDTLGSAGYSNLLNHRDTIDYIIKTNNDLPLAAGDRVIKTIRANKGLWVLHMLRFLLFDPETFSDKTFFRFLNEFSYRSGMEKYTNHSFIKLAEKYYGAPLDWFANQWLYGVNYPNYDARYSINSDNGQYSVQIEITTKGVDPGFSTPMLFRVVNTDGSSTFIRHEVSGMSDSFVLGPFENEPEELIFNEFYSVLCKSKCNKK